MRRKDDGDVELLDGSIDAVDVAPDGHHAAALVHLHERFLEYDVYQDVVIVIEYPW